MNNPRVPTPIALGVLGFLAICVAILGLLVWGGKDTAPLISFVIGVIPATIGVILISKQTENLANKTDAQTDKLNNIHDNVNGKLDAKLAQLRSEIQAVSNKVDLNHIALPDMEGKPKPTPKPRGKAK